MYLHYVALNTSHESDFIQERPKGVVDFLLLHFKTNTTLIINGFTYVISTPSIVLISPLTPHRYFPNSASYSDDYVHFAVEDVEAFLHELTFPVNSPIPLSNNNSIHTLLRLISDEFRMDNIHFIQIITLLIKLLMLKIGETWETLQAQSKAIPHLEDLIRIRSRVLDYPANNWSVEELAESAHLSLAYFQVLYKKAFGITVINDLINAKISLAKNYLSSTHLPIYQIAQESGYTETTHFIRQFKKHTGLTPGAFRKQILQSEKTS